MALALLPLVYRSAPLGQTLGGQRLVPGSNGHLLSRLEAPGILMLPFLQELTNQKHTMVMKIRRAPYEIAELSLSRTVASPTASIT